MEGRVRKLEEGLAAGEVLEERVKEFEKQAKVSGIERGSGWKLKAVKKENTWSSA